MTPAETVNPADDGDGTSPPGPRSAPNRLVLALYAALGVVIPSLLVLWATTRVPGPGATVVRWILFLVILPPYYVYIGLDLRRTFPRDTLEGLRFFLPLAGNLLLYTISYDGPESFALHYLLSSLPLFLGFMLLLLAGLVLLFIRNADVREPGAIVASVLIIALGAAPVLYVAWLGYVLGTAQASGYMAAWKVCLSYVTSIAFVAYLHFRPIQQLYREGKL